LALYDDVTVYGLSKPEFRLPDGFTDGLGGNIKYILCENFDDLPRNVNVLYHTRIQSERFEGDFGRERFIVDKAVLDRFSEGTMLLHPLPRNEEIATDVDSDPRALFFEQTHNGVPVRMALLMKVMGVG
jgi:aspartate carbamoyltransferase catalytic subunit